MKILLRKYLKKIKDTGK